LPKRQQKLNKRLYFDKFEYTQLTSNSNSDAVIMAELESL